MRLATDGLKSCRVDALEQCRSQLADGGPQFVHRRLAVRLDLVLFVAEVLPLGFVAIDSAARRLDPVAFGSHDFATLLL